MGFRDLGGDFSKLHLWIFFVYIVLDFKYFTFVFKKLPSLIGSNSRAYNIRLGIFVRQISIHHWKGGA